MELVHIVARQYSRNPQHLDELVAEGYYCVVVWADQTDQMFRTNLNVKLRNYGYDNEVRRLQGHVVVRGLDIDQPDKSSDIDLYDFMDQMSTLTLRQQNLIYKILEGSTIADIAEKHAYSIKTVRFEIAAALKGLGYAK